MKASINKRLKSSRTDLATRLLGLRKAKGLTQDGLAEAASLDRKTVNRIENEHFSPSIETLLRVCEALNTTPSKVLKGITVNR